MPGPPPKPTKLKLLAGNPGKRPLNENEPEPEAVAPSVPAHLDDEAGVTLKLLRGGITENTSTLK